MVTFLALSGSSLLAGVLPFGAMFIELFFIFSAIWENQFYYMFGFLFLVYIILTISCSQISIVLAYFQLCGEVGGCSEPRADGPVSASSGTRRGAPIQPARGRAAKFKESLNHLTWG